MQNVLDHTVGQRVVNGEPAPDDEEVVDDGRRTMGWLQMMEVW